MTECGHLRQRFDPSPSMVALSDRSACSPSMRRSIESPRLLPPDAAGFLFNCGVERTPACFVAFMRPQKGTTAIKLPQ